MQKILYIIIARNNGGVERRFNNLYKHYSTNNYNKKITFIISRAQCNLNEYKLNNNVRLIKVGLPRYNITLKKIDLFFRIIDYIHLFLVLLFFKKVDITHFVTLSSTKLFKLIKSRKYIYSYVDSSKIKIEEKKYIISFVSRFIDYKGIELLLPVIKHFNYNNKDVKFNILGKGYIINEISRFIKENNISNILRFGFEKEPINILKESLIFLSLQKMENYPSQSLIEAMACGNAIVATNVGLTSTIVKPEFGFLINNEDELINSINYLINNKQKAITMGLKASEFVKKEHTVENFVKYLLKTVYI